MATKTARRREDALQGRKAGRGERSKGDYSGKKELFYYRASVATHPMFFVIFSLLLFYAFPVHAGGLQLVQELVTGIAFFALLPFLLMYKPIKRGEITVNLENQEKRNKFFTPWAIIFASAFLFYSYFNAKPHAALALAFFATMILLHLLNRHSKISWHAMGLSIISVALAYYYGTIALVLFATLLPFACYARWKLKAHTPFQLAAGAVSGAAIAYASLLIA